jgi:hypothetical protein
LIRAVFFVEGGDAGRAGPLALSRRGRGGVMGRGTDLLKKSLACGGEVFLLARGAGGFFGEIAGGMGRRRCLTFAAACQAGVAKRMGWGRLCKTHIELGKIGGRAGDGASLRPRGLRAGGAPGVWVRCGEPTLPFGTMGRRMCEGRGRAFWEDCWRDGTAAVFDFCGRGPVGFSMASGTHALHGSLGFRSGEVSTPPSQTAGTAVPPSRGWRGSAYRKELVGMDRRAVRLLWPRAGVGGG